MEAAAPLARLRPHRDGLLWEVPEDDGPGRLSEATAAHVVLQAHPDARPSQVRDESTLSAFWRQVVAPDILDTLFFPD